MLNEWGLAVPGSPRGLGQAATTPPAFPTAATVGGAIVGIALGGAVGYGLMGGFNTETAVAAGIGGVAGGALGYYMGKPATTTA